MSRKDVNVIHKEKQAPFHFVNAVNLSDEPDPVARMVYFVHNIVE